MPIAQKHLGLLLETFCVWVLNDKRGGISCVICSKWWSDLSECMLNITGVSSTGKMLTPQTKV